MKIFVGFVLSLLCLSCVHAPAIFVQDKFVIVPPVRQKLGPDGSVVVQAFNDGGTEMVQIVDGNGKTFDVYIDHRIGQENQWGTFYIGGYPGTAGSVKIRNKAKFKRTIGQLRYFK